MITLFTFAFLMFAAQENVLHRAPVDYPSTALEKGIQDSVVVEVNVDSEGLVTDARVVSGAPELRNAALRSVLDWHFSKQMHLPAVTQVTVDFKLPENAAGFSKAMLAKAPIEPQLVQLINIQGLTDTARDALLARLPVRQGDIVDSDIYDRVQTEVQAFDEHLRVVLIKNPKGAILDISHAPPKRNYFAGNPRALARGGLEATVSPSRLLVGGNVQQAKLIRQARPVYPAEAKMAGLQGTVRMNALIGRDGTVRDLELVIGPPGSRLQRWRR